MKIRLNNNKFMRFLTDNRRISARFRIINIMLFTIAFCIMSTVMLVEFNGVISKISCEYTERYAESASEALSAHIIKEIGFMSKAAHSSAVIEWLMDENDESKKARAYEEMSGIVGELYSYNMYIGVNNSLNEYRVDMEHDYDNFIPIAFLDKGNEEDLWYFESIASDNEYIISVDIDHILQRKRVWLDYNVIKDGEPLGVVCTGLDFTHVATELFSYYASNSMRGVIIDSKGFIHMDSYMLQNQDFLHNPYEKHSEDVFPDANIYTAIRNHIAGIDGYTDKMEKPNAIRITFGPYSYMTISTIRYTDWSVVVFYDSTTLFDITYFMPIVVVVLCLLVAFALVTSAANYRLIFQPLSKLDQSLLQIHERRDEPIYGIERNDELGHLAKTIQDLFMKANVDALTGIYNRRFMENNLIHIMEFLSRSSGLLSVLMLDIDQFKKYNDTYGHDRGDACLKEVAQALSASVTRSNDFVARYGGEEFVAILPNTNEAGARVVAEKLMENVRKLKIPHAGNTVAPNVTISVGVTTGKVSYMQNWEAYIKRADEALYISKKNGRNRCTFLVY